MTTKQCGFTQKDRSTQCHVIFQYFSYMFTRNSHAVSHIRDSDAIYIWTGHNDMSRDTNKDTSWTLLLPAVDRLVATCDTSTTWCENKASQLLRAGALAGFLLVTHSDLQVWSIHHHVSRPFANTDIVPGLLSPLPTHCSCFVTWSLDVTHVGHFVLTLQLM